MNIARNEIRTGLFVLLTLAVLVGVILYLGAPGVFTPMNTYWVYVENAAGLKPGNDVLLAGRKVGQVVKLFSPVPEANRPMVHGVQNMKLETLIEVRVTHKAVIYKDVRVYITQNGLLGDMLMDFTSGREWSGLASEGDTFIGERTPGLDQAAPLILEKLDPALKKVNETLDALEKTANNLTKLTSDGGDVQVALKEFRKVATNLDELSNAKGPLRLTLENMQKLTEPDAKLGQALEHFEELTNEKSSLAKTLKNAEQFTAKLNSNNDINVTLGNFRRLSQQLNSTVGGLGPQFSAIATNLEQASDTVKHQPWRLIWPSTKKYPEDKLKQPANRGQQRTGGQQLPGAQQRPGTQAQPRPATPVQQRPTLHFWGKPAAGGDEKTVVRPIERRRD